MRWWRRRTGKDPIVAYRTRFNAMESYEKLLEGRMTLDEFRTARMDTEVHPIYASDLSEGESDGKVQ